MRVAAALFLLVSLTFAENGSLAEKFPAGATAYVEVRGLAGKLEAALASPLGASIKRHPILEFLEQTPEAQDALAKLEHVRTVTGIGPGELLRALTGQRLAVARYGADKATIAMARMDAQTAERLISGVEKLFGIERTLLLPAEENAPVVWGLFDVGVFHDGDCLVVTPDRLLATSVRGKTFKGLDRDERFAAARETAGGEATLFGFVDLTRFSEKLSRRDKPRNVGEALILGAFSHYLPKAPWASFKLDLLERDGGWAIVGEGFLPVPGEGKADGPVERAYRGTLEPLPFALPDRTVGLVRMRRDLASVWSHRDELIAPGGVTGLVRFETNFGNLAGGMSWVQEVLPNFGDDFILLGTRRVYEQGEPAPAVRFPQGALLLPLKNSAELGGKLQVAFHNTIGILNITQGMAGHHLMPTATEYKGVRILQTTYMTPTEAEMEGKTALPPRFNLAPACATVGDYFVVASHGDIVREIIDGYGKPGPAPQGVNAGIWLEPDQIRAWLRENRDWLVAQNMIDEGVARAEAENNIKVLTELSRYVRSLELTARESRATMGLRLELGLGAPAE